MHTYLLQITGAARDRLSSRKARGQAWQIHHFLREIGMLVEVGQPDCYSAAAAQRMGDVVQRHVALLREIGAVDQYRHLFFGERVTLEGRSRVLSDFVDIDILPSRLGHVVKLALATPGVRDAVMTICAEARISPVTTNDTGLNYIALLPQPSEADIQAMIDATARTLRETKAGISKVKADTMQRITAALKREYIDPADARNVRILLDRLYAMNIEAVEALTVKKRKAVLGASFTAKSQREMELCDIAETDRYAKIAV